MLTSVYSVFLLQIAPLVPVAFDVKILGNRDWTSLWSTQPRKYEESQFLQLPLPFESQPHRPKHLRVTNSYF